VVAGVAGLTLAPLADPQVDAEIAELVDDRVIGPRGHEHLERTIERPGDDPRGQRGVATAGDGQILGRRRAERFAHQQVQRHAEEVAGLV
jgi:hypothetical protein